MSSTMQPGDKWIPWYFVLFFVVLALVDGVMVTLAVRTQTGTVTDHPYEKGLAYNKVVEAQAKQDALGWKGAVAYENNRLRFMLKDASGNVLTPDSASAYFTRPTQSGMDFAVELPRGEADISFPANGLWEVRVEAAVKGVHYQQSRRIVVP